MSVGIMASGVHIAAAGGNASVAQYAQTASFLTVGASKTISGLAWSSGDVIVVVGGLENGSESRTLGTPTNANLTFNLVTSQTAGGANESAAYAWRAIAGSAQTGQTITIPETETGGNDGLWGAGAVVVTSASTIGVSGGNQTESALSLTVAAGSVVVYWCSDWNANTTNQTPATGSGTAVERADFGDGATWGGYCATWENTSAGTFGFGPSSYTGLQISQVAVEVLKAA